VFCGGNASPAAEANILNDPEAADLVFGADCPLMMCGLDVTEKTVMSTEVLRSIGDLPGARAEHIARIVPFYRDFYQGRVGLDGIFVHDSSVISYLLAPELFTTASHPIRVDTAHGFGRGKTWAALRVSDHETPWSGRRPVTICTGVDNDAVVAMELARLA
jgi:inosine-uridine nucleoside N-ribohydrolase